MTAQLEDIKTVHLFDGQNFVAEAALNLDATNINEHAGELVMAIPYTDGQPTLISGPVSGHNGQEIAADPDKGTFYVPTILGRLASKHSDTHFIVTPLSHEKGNKAEPPRLFAFGKALVRLASTAKA